VRASSIDSLTGYLHSQSVTPPRWGNTGGYRYIAPEVTFNYSFHGGDELHLDSYGMLFILLVNVTQRSEWDDAISRSSYSVGSHG